MRKKSDPGESRKSWRSVSIWKNGDYLGHYVNIIQERIPEWFTPTGILFSVSPTIRSREFSLIVWIILLFMMNDLWHPDENAWRQLVFNSFHGKMDRKLIIPGCQGDIVFKGFDKDYIFQFQFDKSRTFLDKISLRLLYFATSLREKYRIVLSIALQKRP